MKRKNIFGLCETYFAMIKGRTKGREKDGSQRFGEEQAQENDSIRGQLYVNSLLVGRLVWPCPVPNQHSLSYLIKLYFQLFS